MAVPPYAWRLANRRHGSDGNWRVRKFPPEGLFFLFPFLVKRGCAGVRTNNKTGVGHFAFLYLYPSYFFWRELSDTPHIRGLEQPCLEHIHPYGDEWLFRHTPGEWQIVVTAVMKTMRRRGTTAIFCCRWR